MYAFAFVTSILLNRVMEKKEKIYCQKQMMLKFFKKLSQFGRMSKSTKCNSKPN